jgi:hypothetical protein
MSAQADLRATRPLRHCLAVTVYRGLWWSAVAPALPFVLVAALVDWLSWTAFPAIARVTQPALGAAHSGAVWVGNLILGYEPDKERS